MNAATTGIEQGETISLRSAPARLLDACERIRSSRSFLAECADRELNPGYELGKLMSCH